MNLKRQEVAKKLPVLSEETIQILEFSLKNKGNQDEWINVSANTLIELKGIVHPSWEDAYLPRRFKEVIEDIKADITFAFYWKEGFLCWER